MGANSTFHLQSSQGFEPTLSDLQVKQIQICGHMNYAVHMAFQKIFQGTVLQVSFSILRNNDSLLHIKVKIVAAMCTVDAE